MPERTAPDPLYVAARHVLLDALEALGAQRNAAILVGAHAIYLRVGEGDLATTPHTTDADLALDPSLLGGDPRLDEALVAAGFLAKVGTSGPVVGSWVTQQTVEGRAVQGARRALNASVCNVSLEVANGVVHVEAVHQGADATQVAPRKRNSGAVAPEGPRSRNLLGMITHDIGITGVMCNPSPFRPPGRCSLWSTHHLPTLRRLFGEHRAVKDRDARFRRCRFARGGPRRAPPPTAHTSKHVSCHVAPHIGSVKLQKLSIGGSRPCVQSSPRRASGTARAASRYAPSTTSTPARTGHAGTPCASRESVRSDRASERSSGLTLRRGHRACQPDAAGPHLASQ
jgi:hypothetical protein